MQLQKLLQNIPYTNIQGTEQIEINHIVYDSRKVEKGDVFVCISGFQTDGHRYIPMALEKGAVAIVTEREVSDIPQNVTVIQTENNRKTLAQMAVVYYENPTKSLCMIGVTGTNGKTSITYYIQSILSEAGNKTGVIGTIENRIGDTIIPTERTTPESLELQALLQRMKQEDVSHVMMEVSSHSLDLHRVDGVAYDVAVFTNLTQDHLDYHKTMENYQKAKGLLFAKSEKSVINMDDDAGQYMADCANGSVMTYGIDKDADLKAEQIVVSAEGTMFTLLYKQKSYAVQLHTPGRFSVYNALGAIGACLCLGMDIETVLKGISKNKGIAGRFQSIHSKKGCTAIVDYAHTPDGLVNVLKTAREFAKGRLIAVFGCGGDRDKTKRPIMGECGGKFADYCILTSDNPRTEDPIQILRDVEVGTKSVTKNYEIEPDRKKAIQRAVSLANTNDVILIAGKGHETYQIFADKTIHFDDVEEVQNAFGEDCL